MIWHEIIRKSGRGHQADGWGHRADGRRLRLVRLPKTKKGRVTQVTRSFPVCNSISLSKSEEIVPVVKVEPKVFEQIVKI